ncbi:MAG: hypothetical protein ACNA8W_16880 [Bradymonadaceae bacterium]
MHHLSTITILAIAITLLGCSTTVTQTRQRPDSGQFVGSAGIDGPGARIIAQATVGAFQVGDVSIHGGTHLDILKQEGVLHSGNLGGSARAYLGAATDLGLQVDYMTGYEGYFGGLYMLTLTPRLLTNLPWLSGPTETYYAGLQSNVSMGRQLVYHTDESTGMTTSSIESQIRTVLFGVVVGYETSLTDSINIQVELTASPVGMNSDGSLMLGWQDAIEHCWGPQPCPSALQGSVGINFR